jgi:hypothetical protein
MEEREKGICVTKERIVKGYQLIKQSSQSRQKEKKVGRKDKKETNGQTFPHRNTFQKKRNQTAKKCQRRLPRWPNPMSSNGLSSTRVTSTTAMFPPVLTFPERGRRIHTE